MTRGDAGDPRTRLLADNLAATRDRIRRAATASGRDPESVTLIVVTKTYPADDVRRLVDLGVREFGENRVQEAAAKSDAGAVGENYAQEVVHKLGGVPHAFGVHFIGQLQTNKAAQAIRYADAIHTLDRAKLVAPLARASAATDRHPAILIQVSLDGDPARGGAPVADVPALVESALAAGLALRGVMAVPPLGTDPARAFADLARIRERVLKQAPAATMMSAGMSADLEAAVAAGATHLRVGSAILGSRVRVG